MANATYETLELRFILKPEWTECYVLLSAPSDGMLGVQGWHFKQYNPDYSVLAILESMRDGNATDEPLLWPQKAPPDYHRLISDSGRPTITIDIDDGTPT